MEARVKSGLWVSAALRLAAGQGRSGVVVRKGDADSGGVITVLRGRAGFVVLSQTRDGAGEPAWLRATGPTPVEERVADEYIARATSRDPDIWVIEFEAPDYLPPFAGKLL